jgi:hypothetical protein
MKPSKCTPSSLRAFQRDQELDLKYPGLVDLISTKQTNYLPSYIDMQTRFKLFLVSIFYSTSIMSINEGSYIHETHFYQAQLVKKHIFINGDSSSHQFYFQQILGTLILNACTLPFELKI